MIPRRFRNWVIFWTIIVWFVLELLTYPKDSAHHQRHLRR